MQGATRPRTWLRGEIRRRLRPDDLAQLGLGLTGAKGVARSMYSPLLSPQPGRRPAGSAAVRGTPSYAQDGWL